MALPVAEGIPAPAPVPPAADDAATRQPATGTVLFVDDEELIRRFAKSALATAGFRVLVARDADEALEVFGSHRDEVSVALVDLTLPGPDGREIRRRLHAQRPDLPVLLSSGFRGDDNEKLEREGFAGFLQKPYRLEELLSALRAAIAGD